MASLQTVLVVDDSIINRTILAKILSDDYLVLRAENGKVALKMLSEHTDEIAAVMLDLAMPVLDGYDFLRSVGSNAAYDNLPIVVSTGSSDENSEIKALTLGAWDFVSKPYNAEIIKFRLRNVIDRSQLSALKQLKYLAEYDALTGIYNKAKFFDETRKMLDADPNETFVFLRFDVDRFQLINSFFGADEGDKLLIYIAEHTKEDALRCEKVSYGRIESDIFGICLPYEKVAVENLVRQSKQTLAGYNKNYDIVPSIGIYVIGDNSISVEEMYNRATLAAKTCKGNYVEFFAYYNDSMSAALLAEQEITNEMNFALENGQFEIYLQPQYNIHTNAPCGAEALVRWIHPRKGILAPDDFIPIFERNGFITKLDYYVWEKTCQCLKKWKEQGIKPYPLSVNVSRVNIYNPNLVETMLKLVEKYQLEPELLKLELTESGYTDNPAAMKKVMKQFQSNGFTIMMDDFGSGYSSLSLLKDITIDVLKIDMHFLSQTEDPGRGENIIASVIRMAKWLDIPVIAEGAETGEQVDFLRSVGCDYVQGYYFARPMQISEYEQLCIRSPMGQIITNEKHEELFFSNKEMQQLFSNTLQAAAVYEFTDDQIETIRVNEAYYALLGHDDMRAMSPNLLNLVDEADRVPLLKAIQTCAATHRITECEYMRRRAIGTPLWIHTKLSYAATVGNKQILVGELTDVTVRRTVDTELQKIKSSWLSGSSSANTILIVDDAEINRIVLKNILKNQFSFLEAENGEEAIRVIEQSKSQIDLILLDISMPVMDGKEFLKYKKNSRELDGIPVIMITADDSPGQQISTLSLGANDYIVKPFIPEVVNCRVKNVMESNRRFREMVQEYNTMSEQAKTDSMTGLINRVSAEEMITRDLADGWESCAMVMLDIDNFKHINDTYGHDYGDKVICAIAEKLRLFFRKEDVVARMGGDEFAVFLKSIPNVEMIENKVQEFCSGMPDIVIGGRNAEITCSVGIAVSTEAAHSFEALYQNADKALYDAKCHGRNTVFVYGKKSACEEATNNVK